MLYRFDTIEQAWARLKADPFWTEGVWDRTKTIVRELDPEPIDATMKLV
jgi:hypothetical protein